MYTGKRIVKFRKKVSRMFHDLKYRMRLYPGRINLRDSPGGESLEWLKL